MPLPVLFCYFKKNTYLCGRNKKTQNNGALKHFNMRPEEKTIKELLKKGYSTLKTDGYKNYDEYPDVWRLLEVWFGVGRKSLYLDYERLCDIYHFYFYRNRKEAAAKRQETAGGTERYHVERYLREKMPYYTLARKVARTVAGKKGYYCTENIGVTNAVVGDIENFAFLVNWFVGSKTCIGYAFDEDKPMLLVGEYNDLYDILKGMGYESHMDEDEGIEVFDDIVLESVW